MLGDEGSQRQENRQKQQTNESLDFTDGKRSTCRPIHHDFNNLFPQTMLCLLDNGTGHTVADKIGKEDSTLWIQILFTYCKIFQGGAQFSHFMSCY